MRKSILIALAVVLVLVLGAGAVWANNTGIPASKATAKVSELTLLQWEPEPPSGNSSENMTGNIPEEDYNGSWTTILTQNIKTPNQKDLIIDVSLETGLYTRTLVRSKRNYEGLGHVHSPCKGNGASGC